MLMSEMLLQKNSCPIHTGRANCQRREKSLVYIFLELLTNSVLQMTLKEIFFNMRNLCLLKGLQEWLLFNFW